MITGQIQDMGRLHRSLDGPDRREMTLKLTFAGGAAAFTTLVPAEGADAATVGRREALLRVAEELVERLRGMQVRLEFDTLSPAAPAGGLAAAHTSSIIGRI
jgi:hypothetical protein